MSRTLIRISPLSAAKIFAALYFVMGLLLVPFFAFPVLMGAEGQGVFPLGLALFMPVFYAALGFFGTAFFCWLYNLFAGRIGGIEVEISGRDEHHAY